MMEQNENLNEDIKTIRCSICGTEFSDEELTKFEKETGKYGCPSCGTKSLPCAISDDVNIKINWHELHILVVWAEFWARHNDNIKILDEPMLKSVMIIAERLQRQFPEKNKLTLFSEIRELKKTIGEIGGVVSSNLDNDEDLGL